MNFENFSNYTPLLICAAIVILWAILGRLLFRAYVFSAFALHNKAESVLVVLCGPSVWRTTWRLRRKRTHLKQLDSLREGL